MKKLLTILPILAAISLMPGCTTPRLAESVSAQPVDQLLQVALYKADLEFTTADTITGLILQWERENRAILWQVNPQIKYKLDKVRINLPTARAAYFMARDLYTNINDSQSVIDLRAAVARMQELQSAADAAKRLAF